MDASTTQLSLFYLTGVGLRLARQAQLKPELGPTQDSHMQKIQNEGRHIAIAQLLLDLRVVCTCMGLTGPPVKVLWVFGFLVYELKLELIQTHMTQKPLLWVEVEVGAHAVRKRLECAGVVNGRACRVAESR
jgi:hypothetical protein